MSKVALDTTYWHDTPETFTFVRHEWDVRAAKELLRAKRRKVSTMDIAGVAALIQTPESGVVRMGITIDWTKVADCDLSVPVILVPFQNSYLPIDGWHRIAKAHQAGIASLPCVVLTAKEAAKVGS